MDLQTLIDENKKLEDALKSDESNDSSQESDDTDNEDLSNYSEDPKSSQERNDTDAEDLDNDNEEPQLESLNGYSGHVQEFEKHTYEPSRSFLTYEADLDNFNEDATSTEAQDNSQISLVENEYAEDDYTASRIDDQLDVSVEADPNDIDISYENALVFNETYQHRLNVVLETLMEALQENQNRQLEIESELAELEQGKELSEYNKKYSGIKTDTLLPSNPLASNNRKATVSIFAAPYFKDSSLFSHPDNSDTIRKKMETDIDIYLTAPKEWRKLERKQLYIAVKQNAISKMLTRNGLTEKRKSLESQASSRYTDEKEREGLLLQLKQVMAEINIIQLQPDEELFSARDEEFDWLAISSQEFQGFFSEKSCRLMWKNVVHPSLNHQKWSRQEDDVLKESVDQLLLCRNGFVDWEYVAAEVGNRRSALHCFMRFQQRHNTSLDKRRWTFQEDEKLKKLVTRCNISTHFIPWQKIAYYMANRTKDQCYQRYTISLQPHLRKGIFTQSEDFVIIIGVKLFGHNWAKIAEYLPNRTPIQIHSRFNIFIKANFEPWSREEDHKLINLVKEKGISIWAEIAQNFEKRTRSQCRSRFHIILKMWEEYGEGFTLDKLQYRSKDHISLQRRRQIQLYEALEDALCTFLANQESKDVVNSEIIERFSNSTVAIDKIVGESIPYEIEENSSIDNYPLQISDDEDLTLASDAECFEVDLASTTFNTITKEEKDSTMINQNTVANEEISTHSSYRSVNRHYQLTPNGVKISKNDLLKFVLKIQDDLPLKASIGESGAYESQKYQTTTKGTDESARYRLFQTHMPSKRMSAFVHKDKRGTLVTKYKGHRGRCSKVPSIASRQSMINRNLSSYFRCSWLGRVAKPVVMFKMAKGHNDQLRRALAAANYYGKILQIYPYDLRYKATILKETSERISLESLLELYLSRRNENLFGEKRIQEPHIITPQKTSVRTYSRKTKCKSLTAVSTKNGINFEEQNRTLSNVDYSKESIDLIPIQTLHRKSSVQFIAPNNHTMVGVRGLILLQRTLKLVVYPNFTGVRVNLDKMVKEGIHHIDLFSDLPPEMIYSNQNRSLRDTVCSEPVISNHLTSSSKPNLDNSSIENELGWSGGGEAEIWSQTKLAAKEADDLLIDRFLSIYFWPSQMTSVRPSSFEGLFENSREHNLVSAYASLEGSSTANFLMNSSGQNQRKYSSLVTGKERFAAEDPLDASDIIEDAKTKVAAAARKKTLEENGSSYSFQATYVDPKEGSTNQDITFLPRMNSCHTDKHHPDMSKVPFSRDTPASKNQDTIICTPSGSMEQNTAQILSTSSTSSSAKYESNNENTSIAPPPPKKRMLLSLEENMHTNVPCDNSANPHSFVKVAKQPKTYSRNRKKPIL